MPVQIAEVHMEDVDPDDGRLTGMQKLSKLVSELEKWKRADSPLKLQEDISLKLRSVLNAFPQVVPEEDSLHMWKLSYRIWNSCVDMANTKEEYCGISHAKLRQIASDMLLIAGTTGTVQSSLLKMAIFFSRTGSCWYEIKKYEMAEACFDKATELCSKVREEHSAGSSTLEIRESHLVTFDIYTARAKTAWALSQKALTSNLLGRASSLLPSVPEKAQELAELYLQYGRILLSKLDDTDSAPDAIPYLEEAYEICSSASESTEEEQQQRALSVLKLRTLRYLAGAHAELKHYEEALKCTTKLKANSDHPSIPFIDLKIFCGLHRFEEAESELLSLVSHEKLTVELGVAAILNVIQTSEFSEGIRVAKQAFFGLQRKFPGNSKMILSVVEALLANLKQVEHVEAAVEIAMNDDVSRVIHNASARHERGAASKESTEEPQCMFAMLWNSAAELFQARDHNLSRKLFEASLLYISANNSEQKAKALRVIALCHIGASQYDRASECINLAEQVYEYEENVYDSHLILEAAKQVEKMLSYSDFEPDYLTLACHEAIACNSTNAALAALSSLLDLYKKGRSMEVKQVVVLRNIIVLLTEKAESIDHGEALSYYKMAKDKLGEQGFDTFFGGGPTGQKEARWFAGSAWNHGVEAGKKDNWQACAEYLEVASYFFEALPETAETLNSLRLSLLLAAASLLAPESNADGEQLKRASSCLDRCRKVHTLMQSNLNLSSQKNGSETYFYLLLFDLKGRLKDRPAQLEILQKCKSLPGIKAEHFFKLGLHACEDAHDRSSIEVAMSALRVCLSTSLGSPSPDYAATAATLRKLIGLADLLGRDGPEVLALYKEAQKVLAGLAPDVYPKDEVHWLVSTSWNRAPLHVKFHRLEEAEQWMKVALDLLKYAPHMESHKASMLESLAEVQKDENSSGPMEE
eukprot:jgi/Mesen1/3010/ME000177S02279